MQMNTKELEAFAKKAAKGIKTPQDLNDFSRMLKKITVEAALNAEMDDLFFFFIQPGKAAIPARYVNPMDTTHFLKYQS
jgi:hypothetical protein